MCRYRSTSHTFSLAIERWRTPNKRTRILCFETSCTWVGGAFSTSGCDYCTTLCLCVHRATTRSSNRITVSLASSNTCGKANVQSCDFVLRHALLSAHWRKRFVLTMDRGRRPFDLTGKCPCNEMRPLHVMNTTLGQCEQYLNC